VSNKAATGARMTHGCGLAHFCRELCEVVLFEKREKLGGSGKIVEIDESKIGKRKYHRGQVVEGQWVFGGIEMNMQKVLHCYC